MAATKIKTNHPFTVLQLNELNKQLAKISNNEVVALRSVKFNSKKNIIDIEVKKSAYILDVFLSFTDISDPERPIFNMYKIDAKGNIDYTPKQTLEFNSLVDRITFFNELQPIEFYY